MNEQEFDIINRETKKQKIINFVKINKNIIIILILIIISLIIGFFSFAIYEDRKRANLANKFNNAANNYEVGSNPYILENMSEIIKSRDKTYSPLALYFLIDNDLIKSVEDVNKYFDMIIYDLKLDTNLAQLNLYKKALYNADRLSEKELLNMIDPILNKENVWQSHSLYLLAEYYYSKGEKEKSLVYYQKIISNTNSNSEIKVSAKKRVQRDFSD